MSSISIDTLLKVSASPTKLPAPNEARDSVEQFENYLRQAASSHAASEKSAQDQNPKAPKAADAANTSGDQQGTTSSPDDETKSASLESNDVVEEETDATIVDEVLLSSTASVIIMTPAEIITGVDFTGEEVIADPIAVLPQTEQTVPTPTVESDAASQWLEELAAAVETGPPTTTEQLDIFTSAEVLTTVGNVTQEVTTAVEQSVTQQQPEFAAAQLVEPVIAQAAVAAQPAVSRITSGEIKSEESADSENFAESFVYDIETPIPELAASQTTSTSESDGQTSEVHVKTVETPTPTAPTNAGSQQTLLPTTGSNAGHSAPLAKQDQAASTIDRVRFVQRVANAFRSAQNNDGHIQLRLSPPELGSLRIEIAVRNGVLSANLETETADARRVLLDNLPALRQRLAEQDIRIDKFEVDIRREGGHPDGQANAREQQTEQQTQRTATQNRIRTQAANNEILTTRVVRSSLPTTDAGLDVRI